MARSLSRPLRTLLWGTLFCLCLFLPVTARAASIADHLDPLILQSLRPWIPVYYQGNLEYAYVNLDGEPLFAVAGSPSPDTAKTDRSPLQQRVMAIEASIHQTVNRLDSADSLYTGIASLDKQKIIVAGNRDRVTRATLLTVTELDAQLAQKTIPVLAEEWNEILRRAMRDAWENRRPRARQEQIGRAMAIAGVTFTVNLALVALSRWIYRLFQNRKQKILQAIDTENPFSPSEVADAATAGDRFKETLALQARQNLNALIRRSLRLIRLEIWIIGVSWIFFTFPETRLWGRFIFSFSLKIFTIVFLMLVLVKICRSLIERALTRWVEEASPEKEESQRISPRARTLAGVFGEIVTAIAWGIGAIALIDWQQIPIASLWTGAGLIGVALGIVFQNLLRDWLNGLFIIFGDHYAVGDHVTIGSITGLVESMSLRSTKVRGDGGSLNVIPHGQINIVQNFTKDWSRVDFTVQISRDSDVTRAMEVMQQIAESMAGEPEWRASILEPTSLIGIHEIGASGTRIVMWIKTKRAVQWEVEREFRKRLKETFDEEGIQVT